MKKVENSQVHDYWKIPNTTIEDVSKSNNFDLFIESPNIDQNINFFSAQEKLFDESLSFLSGLADNQKPQNQHFEPQKTIQFRNNQQSISTNFILTKQRAKKTTNLKNLPRVLIRIIINRQKYFEQNLSRQNYLALNNKVRKFTKLHKARLSQAKDLVQLMNLYDEDEERNKEYGRDIRRVFRKLLREECFEEIVFAQLPKSGILEYLKKIKIFSIRCINHDLAHRLRTP